MRKTVWKQMLSLAAAVCMVVCMMPAVAKADDSTIGINYLALGDSISTGYRVDDSERFTNLLAEDLGFNLVNEAVEGETSESLLNTTLEKTEVISAIKNADVITITIGGNDLMNALYQFIADKSGKTLDDVKDILENGTIVEKMKLLGILNNDISDFDANAIIVKICANVSDAIGKIQRLNTNAPIIIASQYNPYDVLQSQFKKLYDAIEVGVKGLNTCLSFLQEDQVVYADVYRAFKDKGGAGLCNANIAAFDLDFHPNANGHEVIAEVMNAAIKMDKVKANSAVRNAAENISKNLSSIQLNQADANTLEMVRKAVEAAVSQYVPSNVSTIINVISSDFVPAVAGTADQKNGTNGSFIAVVTLGANDSTREVEVAGVIKATAYTAPAQDPSQEDDDKDAGKQTAVDNGTNNTDKKPVNTTVSKTDVPKTGDTNSVMPYLLLMLAAATVVIISVHRKRAEK